MIVLPAGLMMVCASPAVAQGTLSAQQERTLQIASISASYSFAAVHAGVQIAAARDGRPLARDWVPSGMVSSVSLVGLSVGYLVLSVGFTDDVDRSVTYALAAPPGLVGGGLVFAGALDGALRDDGDWWMAPGPAVFSLAHGLVVGGSGLALSLGAHPSSSDLSKLGPIYSWSAVGGALVAWSAASLVRAAAQRAPARGDGRRDRRRRRRAHR